MGVLSDKRRYRHLPIWLTGSPQLLPDDSADCRFQWFASTCDVLQERIIDQCLIVTAAGVVHLFAEPIQNAIVEADGHPCFPRRSGDHRSSFCLREVVFTLHKSSAYRSRSPGVAGRAEMILTLLFQIGRAHV